MGERAAARAGALRRPHRLPPPLELAPTTELRQLQYARGRAPGVGKRSAPSSRRRTSSATRGDPRQVDLDADRRGDAGEARAALLCVERDPEACHRSLIAARLAARVRLRDRPPAPIGRGNARPIVRRPSSSPGAKAVSVERKGSEARCTLSGRGVSRATPAWIALALVVTGLVPLLLVTVIGYRTSSGSLRKDTHARLQTAARGTAPSWTSSSSSATATSRRSRAGSVRSRSGPRSSPS